MPNTIRRQFTSELGLSATIMAANKNTPLSGVLYAECPGEDLNLHPVKDTALNRARLPVPPPGQQVKHIILSGLLVSILIGAFGVFMQ